MEADKKKSHVLLGYNNPVDRSPKEYLQQVTDQAKRGDCDTFFNCTLILSQRFSIWANCSKFCDSAFDFTNPDAIVIDIGGGFIAGQDIFGNDIGSLIGVQLAVFRNGPDANGKVHYWTYGTENTDGMCIGLGVQVGLAWLNSKVNEKPSVKNFSEGTTTFYSGGAGVFGATYSKSKNSNGTPLWFSFTAGASYAPSAPEVKAGGCWGNQTSVYRGTVFQCVKK